MLYPIELRARNSLRRRALVLRPDLRQLRPSPAPRRPRSRRPRAGCRSGQRWPASGAPSTASPPRSETPALTMFLTAVRLRSWTNLSGLPAALQAWSHALRNVPSCSPGPDLRTRVSSGGGGSSWCARGEGPRPCLPELTVSEWGGRRARGPYLRHGSMAMSSDPCPRPRGCSFQPASAEPHDRIFTSAAAATHGRHAVRHQSPRRRACLGGSASTPADERG